MPVRRRFSPLPQGAVAWVRRGGTGALHPGFAGVLPGLGETRRHNQWFEEALCETASLSVLVFREGSWRA